MHPSSPSELPRTRSRRPATLSGWADVPGAAITTENDALINVLDVTDLRSRFYRLAPRP